MSRETPIIDVRPPKKTAEERKRSRYNLIPTAALVSVKGWASASLQEDCFLQLNIKLEFYISYGCWNDFFHECRGTPPSLTYI